MPLGISAARRAHDGVAEVEKYINIEVIWFDHLPAVTRHCLDKLKSLSLTNPIIKLKLQYP